MVIATCTRAAWASCIVQPAGDLEEIRCCSGVALILVPWASLGYPLGRSWVAGVLREGFRSHYAVFAKPLPGFDRLGLAIVQMKLHSPRNFLPAAAFRNYVEISATALLEYAPGGRGLPP
jgi:hypothetical protein